MIYCCYQLEFGTVFNRTVGIVIYRRCGYSIGLVRRTWQDRYVSYVPVGLQLIYEAYDIEGNRDF